MKFSLINVRSEKDGKVTGTWLQNHIGTLESALVAAKRTSKINSGLNVAIVDEIAFWRHGV